MSGLVFLTVALLTGTLSMFAGFISTILRTIGEVFFGNLPS